MDANMPVAVKLFLTATSIAKTPSGFSRVKWAARHCSCCGIKPCFKQHIPLMGIGKKKKKVWGCHSPWSTGLWCYWQCNLMSLASSAGTKAWYFLHPISPCSHVLFDHSQPACTATSQALQSTAGILLLPQILSKDPAVWSVNILLYLVLRLPSSSHWNVVITIHLLCKDLQWTMPQWTVPG